MKPARFQRLNELFEAALDLPAAEREAFLRSSAGADAALAEEALRLFQHHDRERVWFDHPPAGLRLDPGDALAPGPTLERRLREAAPVPLDAALNWITQLAESLDDLHRRRSACLCLEPSAVILRGEPPVAAIESRPGAAEPLPIYMAPEQLTGQRAGPPADIYALGLLAFELLTGARPFHGVTPLQEALARLKQPPRDPLALSPDLPAECAAALMRCLERDPARRPRTAMEAAGLFRRRPSLLKRLRLI